MIKLKKICNFRALFFLFLLIMLCIFGATMVYSNKIYLVLLIFPVAYFLYVGIKRKFVLLGISFVILCGVSAFSYLTIKNYEEFIVPDGQVVIVATVDKISMNSYGDYIYYFRDLEYKQDESSPTCKIEGNFSMYVDEESTMLEANRFDRIAFVGKILKNNTNSQNNFYNDNKYKVYISNNSTPIKIEVDKSLIEQFRENNLNYLIQTLGEENGNICYSILYGDRATVASFELDNFKQSGVMHLFAVSGLHVGLLVAVVVWFLSKLKTNGKVQFFLILFFLLGYCILCSFTPSVVRASIMSICFLLSKLFERKYDTLNALSLAGIILLVISPTMFFTIGFQLSFLAVFGVISLSKILSFVKFKSDFMQEFWNAIKLSVSAQMGVLPLMFYYFGGGTTWTLLANLLLIPFFTLFYTLLFVCNIIVVIIPSFGVILKVPGILFDLFVYFNDLIISLPGGYIEYSNVNTLSIVLYMLFLWCGSKYFVVSGRTRAIIVIILVLCITCALIMGNLNLFGGDVNISPQNLPLKTILAQKCG